MPAVTISAENQWTAPMRVGPFPQQIPLSIRRISGSGTKVRARMWFVGQTSADAVFTSPITTETDILETAGDVYVSLGVMTGEYTGGESLVLVLGGL